jgi:hypothetical protein
MNPHRINNLLILSLVIALVAGYLAPVQWSAGAATAQAQEASLVKSLPDVADLQAQNTAFPEYAAQPAHATQTFVSEHIEHGDFEHGDLSGWAMPPHSTVLPAAVPKPIDNSYVAYFGGVANANERLYQPLAFSPEGAANASLSFSVNLYGEETTPGADTFCAALYDSAMTTRLVALECLDGSAASSATFSGEGWQSRAYSLNDNEWALVRGQTVNLVFEMTTNDSLDTVVFLDDVNLSTTTGGTESDTYEPNDAFPADATILTPGQPMSDLSINPTNDQDFFSFSGSAGQVVVVDIDTEPGYSTLDSVVLLLNDRGQEICRNDDDPATLDSYLACPLPVNGTYYVLVHSYDGTGSSSATYTLSVGLHPADSVPPPTYTQPEQPPVPASGAAWTAMLYLAGDNDMCDEYPPLIARMEQELGSKIGDDGFLNIVVLFDRNAEHCAGQGGTTRFAVQENGIYQEGTNHWDMGELNMGDPQTLVDFATWAMEHYPAEHYYLALDNHGGGITGIASDATNGDKMRNIELHAALEQITHNGQDKLDVLSYEACLMGLYETAYDVREFTDYIFFFETVSWPNEESYSGYLGDERFTATTTGHDLGKIIFDTYFATVQGPHTPALIDTSHLDELHTAVNDWASMLHMMARTSRPAMTAARQAAQKIDILQESHSYLDLWDLADQMAAHGVAVPQSEAVKAAIDAAVVNTNNRSSGAHDYTNTHGMSIFWPEDTGGWYPAYISNQLYATTSESTWGTFLSAYNGTTDRSGLPTEPGTMPSLPSKDRTTVYLPIVLH